MNQLVEILTNEDEFACYLLAPVGQDLSFFLDQLVGDFYQTLDYKIGQVHVVNQLGITSNS